MVKKEEKDEKELAPETTEKTEIVVTEAVAFTPQSRPNVVSPSNGKWNNPEQEALAKVINTYAYTNPEKWAVKKDALVEQLKELGNK